MKHFIFKILLILLITLHPVDTESLGLKTNPRDLERFLDKLEKERLIREKEILLDEIETRLSQFYIDLQSKHSHRYVTKFIDELTCPAIDSKALPSIVIAQAAIETGYGKYSKLGNNIFGIKGRGLTSKTKEWVNGRFITITDNFQYFPTLTDAINRHFEIINRYKFETREYAEWAIKIKAGGYATDPNYTRKLVYIVKRYNLTELDEIQSLIYTYERYKICPIC